MFADKSSDTSSSNATPAGNKPWNWSNGVTEDSIRETKRELVSFSGDSISLPSYSKFYFSRTELSSWLQPHTTKQLMPSTGQLMLPRMKRL